MKRISMILFLSLIALGLSGQEIGGMGGEESDREGEIFTEDIPNPGFTEEKSSVYGYLVDYLAVSLPGEGEESDVGNILYLRLKGDFRPENKLSFHAELTYRADLGNQNPYALLSKYGLPGLDQSEFPFEDFNQTVSIDHAYGSLNLGRADIQFGKIPLAWGTGYVFNPTARVAHSSFLDNVTEETPGTFALVPSFALSERLALSGYLAFQDKSHGTTAEPEDGDWDRLPWGLKAQAVAGAFDLSVSFLKEVTPEREAWYAGADFAGAAGNFGVYGEAALNIPYEAGKFSFYGTSWDKLLEACLGFDYTIPGIDLETRFEYYHYGPGATDPDDYDVSEVLSGTKSVQGEEYLFLMLSRVFIDYLKLSTSALINLNDGSFALLPEASYDLLDNFQISAGCPLYFGPEGSEFRGEYEISGNPVDLTVPTFYVKAKLSF